MMDTVAIFGAGIMGQAIYALLKNDARVQCFFDNNCSGKADFAGVPIVPFDKAAEFDRIYIAVMNVDAFDAIKQQLLHQGVPSVKIRSYKEVLLYRARVEFLYEYAEQIRNVGYANAEVGCFQGGFAKEINAAFPGNQLYLFDTFQGFTDADIHSDPADEEILKTFSKEFSRTSANMVLGNMPHPESVVMKQGYFPDTFDVCGERFGFVSVDTDLFSPTQSALEVFFPLMIDSGVILVHDYYNDMLPGVRKAVNGFIARTNAAVFPIGDAMSIAVVKQGNGCAETP